MKKLEEEEKIWNISKGKLDVLLNGWNFKKVKEFIIEEKEKGRRKGYEKAGEITRNQQN